MDRALPFLAEVSLYVWHHAVPIAFCAAGIFVLGAALFGSFVD